MEASLAQQEKHIQELIRRANKHPDKTGTLRRDTLNRLIDLTHSSYPSMKSLAAVNIQNYFRDFPDLEDAAIDAIYDLCEDSVSAVRKAGYKAIVQVSREQKKWVKRNADVLVQLLQSDEPDEVQIVKKSLNEHLDLDPRVTLGVLCDQIVPPEDLMDDEEQPIRDRLRSLVLSFLTCEAKRAIVSRHANRRGSDEERVLGNGLLMAIPKSTNTETELIVKDLLLSLPSYRSPGLQGEDLLLALLEKAKLCLEVELRKGVPASIKNARFYLGLASFIVTDRRIASANNLLRFYCDNLMGKMTLQRLQDDDQSFVVYGIAESLAAYDANIREGKATPDQLVNFRMQITIASPVLLEVLARSKMPSSRSWNACEILLQACLQRKQESSWVVPANMSSPLHTIDACSMGRPKGEEIQAVQILIRSLLQSIVKPSSPQPSNTQITMSRDIPSGSSSSTALPRDSDSRPSDVPTPRGSNLMTRPRPTREETNARPVPSTNGGHASTSSNNSLSFKRTVAPDESPRPSKKTKKGGDNAQDNTPSLLSRMSSAPAGSSTQNTPTPSIRRLDGKTTVARPVSPSTPDITTPLGGLSIKGAASRETSTPPPPSRAVSLLDRIGGGNASDGRKRSRGKTNL